MQARTYVDVLGDINQLRRAAKHAVKSEQKQELIRELNNIIIKDMVSDKPIAYAPNLPAFASWNIACGALWVDAHNDVSPSKNPLNNPTLNKPVDHDQRMACCRAAIDTLKELGIKAIALQEAPINPKDLLYSAGVVKGPGKANGNISLAIASNNYNLIKHASDPVYAELAALLKANMIDESEVSLFANDSNDYVINMHLNFAKDDQSKAKQKALLVGIADICKRHPNVIAGGDSNMQEPAIKAAKTPANVYGIRGALATDIIMGAAINQYLYIPPEPHPDQKKQKQTTSATSTHAMIAPDNEEINAQLLQDCVVVKGQVGMVQFRFLNEMDANEFLTHVRYLLKTNADDQRKDIVKRDDMKPYFIIRLNKDDYNKLTAEYMPRLEPYNKLETADKIKPLDEQAEVVLGATGMVQFRFNNRDEAGKFCKSARNVLKIEDPDNCINVRNDQKPYHIVRLSKAQYEALQAKSLLKSDMQSKRESSNKKM